MLHSKKVMLNALVMYFKIFVNTIFTLLATRIALKNLGVDSFGLYNLLAGVISMLSFLNGALIISGQRFMSIAIGKKDKEELNKIFNVCLFIHLIFGLIILIGFTTIGSLFVNILNIPAGMENTSYVMFILMVVSSFVTVSVIPYSAMMNAKEDIYIFALTEILSCGLRCASAFAIVLFKTNKLEWYTLMMAGAFFISGLAKVIWARAKYPETRYNKTYMLDKPIRNQMLSFVGWNTLGTSANLARSQGLAILLNVFFGTVINAAYGIANQVSGLVNTIASTITTVFAPSIIQAHGAGDDKRMINVASLTSKITFGICSAASLPLLIFLPSVLNIWLDQVPEYTLWFCRFFIVDFLLKQLTPGINRAIYAIGMIKYFSITVSVLLVSVIPIGYFLLKIGFSVYSVFVYLVIAQILTTGSEILYLNKYIDEFKLVRFSINNLLYPILLFLLCLISSYLLLGNNDSIISLEKVILYSGIVVSIYTALYVLFVTGKEIKIVYSKF